MFLNFLWQRLHSTGFCSGLPVVELTGDVVGVVVVTLACGLGAPLEIVLFDELCCCWLPCEQKVDQNRKITLQNITKVNESIDFSILLI